MKALLQRTPATPGCGSLSSPGSCPRRKLSFSEGSSKEAAAFAGIEVSAAASFSEGPSEAAAASAGSQIALPPGLDPALPVYSEKKQEEGGGPARKQQTRSPRGGDREIPSECRATQPRGSRQTPWLT